MQRVRLSHRSSLSSWLSLAVTVALLAAGLLTPHLGGERPAAAQSAGAPLIILQNGDLWSWTPGSAAPAQLTTWGYISQPALAPGGGRIAYNAWASATVNALAQGQLAGGVIPSNIAVLDLATSQAQTIAEQPAGASLGADGAWQNAIMRGKPAWSPDGGRLAWSELEAPANVYRLVVYDLATGATSVLVPSLPVPYADAGNIPVHQVQWGQTGISVHTVAVNAESGDFEERLTIYDASGALVAEHLIGSASTEFTLLHAWMSAEAGETIGLLYPSGKQFMLDPRSGEQQEMPAPPELVSASATGPSAALILAPNSEPESDERAIWFLVTPDRTSSEALDTTGYPTTEVVAISPDGLSAAFVGEQVQVWANGVVQTVPGAADASETGATAVLWGPQTWRVPAGEVETLFGLGAGAPEAAPGAAMPIYCQPAPRLTVGQLGQVTPGLPNIVRSLPRRGPDSLILGQISGSGVFTVLEGPVCDPEGRFWWRVNYGSLTGWTAEGQGWTYWLQPYTGQPPQCTLTPRLQVGAPGYVLPGLPNLLRAQPRPGPDSPVVGRIPGGGFFTVIGGPQCGPDGRYWWQISYAGMTGWTAEGEGNAYWVAPFVCPNSPLPRLTPGIVGRVTPGLPNTLRVQPASNSSALGQIPGGGYFVVLSGPQCGPEGWSWWHVNYNGIVGWTAEGSGTTYWLEPYVGLPQPPVTCNLPSRLRPGDQGRVTPGEANALRSQPATGPGSAVIGYIPAYGTFRVLEGPVCGTEGRFWLRVEYAGMTGWTPEGEGTTYWLEPLPGTPPTQPVACTLAPRLQVGASGFVLPGPSNVLRSQPRPGEGSDVIGEMPGGAFFRVLEGPVCGPEGRYWWRVNYQGITGWTAEGQGSEYWVQPFMCSSGQLTRLAPGIRARVTPGDPNALRSQPATGPNSVVLGYIPGGAEFTVVSGPQCGNDGRVWWQVNYNGALGWTPEGEGGVYWLEPIG